MNFINFQGKDYPVAIVNLPFGKRKISTVELNESLINEDGSYTSEEARLIDEQLFYFVENKILRLRENEIAETILSEI